MAQRGSVEGIRQQKCVRMGTGVNGKVNGAFLLAEYGRIVPKKYMAWGAWAKLSKPLAMRTHMSACPGINEDMTRYCGCRIRKDSSSGTSHKEMIRTGASSVASPRRVLRCSKCCKWRYGRVLLTGGGGKAGPLGSTA
jgi:hypothetical protein